MSFTHLHVHTERQPARRSRTHRTSGGAGERAGHGFSCHNGSRRHVRRRGFLPRREKAGIRPIIGCEVYTAARTRFDKNADLDKRNGHLILLAESNEGYKNLIKIVSRGYTEGFYYKPRVDNELLRRYSGGIIATSACIAGSVQQALVRGDYGGARAKALEYLDIFGKDHFFLEIQDQGLEEECRDQCLMLKRLSQETGIRTRRHQRRPTISVRRIPGFHDVLLCIQTGAIRR